jgi:hypothetical protein
VISLCLGCQGEWRLRVRDPGRVHIEVDGMPTPTHPRPGAEAGVLFHERELVVDGYERSLDDDGEWMVASHLHASRGPDEAYVDFTLPRRYVSPRVVTVATPLSNACELRVRTAPNRGVGFFGLVLAAPTAGLFAVAGAVNKDGALHDAAPYVAGGALALAFAGAAMILWPAGDRGRR